MAAGLEGSHLTKRRFDSFLELMIDFHLNTYLARILTSYISTSRSLMLKPLLL